MLRFRLVAVLSVILCRALPALAAGIEYPELGAVAVGRGGAATARPEGGLSLIFNPAGMAWTKGLRIDADGKLMWNQVSFTGTDAALLNYTTDPTSKNETVFYGTPTNGAVLYGFGHVGPLQDLAVGVGVFGPSATGKLSYDTAGSTRYEKTAIDYFFAYYSVAVAARINEAWAVGLTLQLAQGTAKFTQAVRGAPLPQEKYDIVSTVNVSSGALPGGVIGVTFVPHDKVALGLSYRPMVHFSGNGTLTSIFPSSLQSLNPKQTGDSASLTLNFPHVARFGAQYMPTSDWLIELDVVAEFWSVFDAARVTPHDITVSAAGQSAKLTEIDFPKQYHTAGSIRLGADWQPLPERLTVRAGYFFETSAIPTRTVSVDFPNWGRHGPAVGASVNLFGAQLHVAYTHHFVPSQTVTDSIVEPVSVPPFSPTVSVVGNGDYTASSDMFVIGLTIDPGKLSKDI